MTKLLTSPRTKRAANVLGIVLLIAVVAPFAVFAVPEVVGADESFVVLTASMTPAIAPGDVVIVAERDPTAIAEGDVITFVRGTSDVPVTHRVIGVSGEGAALAFETMGDANEGPDPGLVPAGNLVGVVTLTIPWIGYVIQFAGTRAGFVALVMLPFGLLAATEVWSIVRDRGESGGQAPATVEPVESTDGAGVEVAAATDAEPASTADAAGGSGGVSVDAVGGAAAVLAAVTPYAVYVAFELRTAVAIAVAVAAATLLLGALAAWIPASGVLDRSGPSAAETDAPAAAADGGVSETDGGADAPATDAGEREGDAVDHPDREIPATTPAPADGAAEADR
ncbi:signal peptidase I [Halorubrum sp. SS5]|nr:signal peptidase I [Halorubrum sp. SS5]